MLSKEFIKIIFHLSLTALAATTCSFSFFMHLIFLKSAFYIFCNPMNILSVHSGKFRADNKIKQDMQRDSDGILICKHNIKKNYGSYSPILWARWNINLHYFWLKCLLCPVIRDIFNNYWIIPCTTRIQRD